MISANENRFRQRIPAVVEGHGKNEDKASAAAKKPLGPMVKAAVKPKAKPAAPAAAASSSTSDDETTPFGEEDEDFMSLIEVLHTEHHSRTQGTSEMCCPCNALTPIPINVPNPYEGDAHVKFK